MPVEIFEAGMLEPMAARRKGVLSLWKDQDHCSLIHSVTFNMASGKHSQ